MTLPVSSIVNVQISVAPQFPSRLGFGTALLITTNPTEITKAERLRFYASLSAVGDDFAVSTEAYAAALVYFSQNPHPQLLAIGGWFNTSTPGEILSGVGPLTVIATWQAITDGEFTLSIDGDEEDILAMDFSGDADLDAVAATIEAELQAIATGGYVAATCVWEATVGKFIITSGTTGASSTMSLLEVVDGGSGTDISEHLAMTSSNSGVELQQGSTAELIEAALDDARNTSNEWYGLVFTREIRDNTVVEDTADWVEANSKVFATCSNDATALTTGTTDIAYYIQNNSLRRSMAVYSSVVDEYPDVSALSRAFVVNFSAPNSTLTLKFKQLPTVASEKLTSTEKLNLDNKNGNAYIDVGGNPMFAEGTMGDGTYFDEVHGVDWLQNAIENNVFGYLYTRTTKVPLTDAGGASIEQQVIKALNEGVVNGLIAPGTTIDGTYLPLGYATLVQPVALMSAAAKANREAPNISFTALLAGAIHSAEINGTVER
jgi:hypothetical protein